MSRLTKTGEIQAPEKVLCDWITVTQAHEDCDTELLTQRSLTFDSDTGQVLFETGRGIQHSGSHNTSVQVKAMGGRVQLSGNVGRLGRYDNVFGFGVEAVKERCNQIMDTLGLPRFTDGSRVSTTGRGDEGRVTYTGAKISRLDLTRNYATGSRENARDFEYWLSTQKIDRNEPLLHRNTLYFGKTSKYSTLKVYIKANELRSNAAKKHGRGDEISREESRYVERLADWCDSVGLVRIEREFKARYLHQKGLRHWCQATDERVNRLYAESCEAIKMRCVQNEEVNSLPVRERSLFHAYMRGENLADYNWSQSTFYRYRRKLLCVGVDIARPLNVKALSVKPRVIELVPVEVPDFYLFQNVA